jgi:ADP-ribosylglycohydrolase
LAVLASGGDLLRSILIAANHVGIDEEGNPTRYEDIDCYGSIAGALAGAIAGVEAFPADMLAQVIESNKAVYSLDLEATIERFIARCI